jgi:hypothetical protein
MVIRKPILWAAGLMGLAVILGVMAIVIRSTPSVAAAPTAGATFTCNPDLVVSANVRVVAHCPAGFMINPTTVIFWFAYPTSDSANASRMLSLFETAKATGSTITFYFDTTDTSGTAYGCQANDCRAIWAATTP